MQVAEWQTPGSVRIPVPDHGEADAVYARIDRYLCALGIHDRIARQRVMDLIRERTAQRAALDPSLALSELAADQFEELIDEWRAQVCFPQKINGSTREDIALLLTELPAEHQCYFLQPGPYPPEFTRLVRQFDVRPHPDLQRAAMAPQSLDLGPITALATLSRNPIFKLATGAAWLLGLILAVIFLFTHL